MDDLTCQELVELVTDYLEDALPAPDRARFDEHLAACEGCRRYLAQMERSIAVTGALAADTLEPAAREELLAVFRAFRR